MKKLVTLLLAACMLLTLAACGQSGTTAPAATTAAPAGDNATAAEPAGPAYTNPLQDVRVRQALWYAIDMDAIVEGLWENNVVAAHTLRLSSALLAAGRPHEVLPLTGITHMATDETVKENLLLLQLDFLRRSLAP